MLSEKPENIEKFSDYTKAAFIHKDKMSIYENEMLKIKNLFDVIQINSKGPLNAEADSLCSELGIVWKQFIVKLQESMHYINMESPKIIQQLQELYDVIIFFQN
jgi:hypothetical protein